MIRSFMLALAVLVPLAITAAVAYAALSLGNAENHSAGLRLRLQAAGYKFRNSRKRWHPRSMLQVAMFLAGVGIFTTLQVTVFRADGRVEKLGIVSHRVVTTAGVNFIRDAFRNTVEAELMNYHASGTGTTAEAVGDTALVTEIATRVAGTQTAGGAGAYVTTATIPYTTTSAVTEHGIFSASSAGTLLDRSVFTAVNVVNGDSIQFAYTLTFSAGG